MNKIEISLTDFVDFVIKSGSPKLTHVKHIKKRPEYHPTYDFYKIVREGIQQYHQDGNSKSQLDDILQNVNDQRKIPKYSKIIKGYKKFIGKKKISYFAPPFDHWRIGNLDVRINPEIGLNIDGNTHIIKLYFKAEDLSKNRITQILALMNEVFKKNGNYKFSIIDIRKSKLHTYEDNNNDLIPLLKGEANSFETIWLNI